MTKEDALNVEKKVILRINALEVVIGDRFPVHAQDPEDVV